MKSLFLKTIAAAMLLSPAVYGLSLYDTAPPIGVPESHAVKYSMSVSGGYDDNLNSQKNGKKGGCFSSFSVGASYADYESALKLSYHAHVGGRLYSDQANSTDQRLFSDISGGVQMSRSLGTGRVFSLNANVSYRPEPDYANSISAARAQGDCLNWSVGAAYSQAIDSRWSWTLSASTSGNVYTKGHYEIDNREYISTSASLNYKSSTRTSYSASTSYRFDMREYGNNSDNIYVNFGVNHSIDPVSSCSLNVGVQSKSIAGENNLYPNLRAGYSRKLATGMSVSSYVSLDNENINTHGRSGGKSYDYLSDLTWRVGVNCSYAVNPLLSVNFGGSLLASSYSKGSNGASDWSHNTWTLTGGLSYKVNNHASLFANYNYTHSTGSYDYGYDRNVVTAGVSYAF